ncbi:MAG TPA: HPr family phosphocarrier protein [Candidatus Kapabacteria bacterium]|jgi:phosphocarrier protein|nr:HPr family phosphocarrier protein [Candidatus Kapabacteria bacterium]HOM04780.1 HPr family phosphocarrier protein [Candidatus Kapabacteria bacterium]HPP39341.1 HPr family phosphocarrier protein [Candidatus Kapabacteria bacterium]HPU23657.1 HPr family phosphocarrier protein [Candidatus Kapabacteria bacterium]HRT68190.1 HPr family phosphocarrier protein [Bacteroidota bacterium]
MVEKLVKVVNRSGIHTRPAASIVKLASKFKSEIYLIRDKFAINGKSIIGVMTLAAEQGSEIKVRAEGPDEQEAVDEIVKLFESGFGEI